MPSKQTKEPPIDERMFILGTRQGRRNILPTVAYTVAKAAKAGEIDVEDARELYTLYHKGVMGDVKIDYSQPTVRVQVSKLRQIIKAADPKLMTRVKKLHEQARADGYLVNQLYGSMVAAARMQDIKRVPLTDEQILKIIRRKP